MAYDEISIVTMLDRLNRARLNNGNLRALVYAVVTLRCLHNCINYSFPFLMISFNLTGGTINNEWITGELQKKICAAINTFIFVLICE